MGSKSPLIAVRGRSRRASRELAFLLALYLMLALGAVGASELVAALAGGMP